MYKKIIMSVIMSLSIMLGSTMSVFAQDNCVVNYRISGNVTPNAVDEVNTLLSKQDPRITSKFNSEGWTLVLCDTNTLQTVAPMSDGYISNIEKTVYINATDNEHIDWDCLHEFGHFIAIYSCFVGWYPTTQEQVLTQNAFNTIFESEKYNSGFGEYHTNTPGEYFAQSYDEMKKNPAVFMKKCPQTYNFISACELWAINGHL